VKDATSICVWRDVFVLDLHLALTTLTARVTVITLGGSTVQKTKVTKMVVGRS